MGLLERLEQSDRMVPAVMVAALLTSLAGCLPSYVVEGSGAGGTGGEDGGGGTGGVTTSSTSSTSSSSTSSTSSSSTSSTSTTMEAQCGNGVIETGEECDDEGYTNMILPVGDEDFCTADCKFKEFDIETGGQATDHNQLPSVGLREDDGTLRFWPLWHFTVAGAIVTRRYGFDAVAPSLPLLAISSSADPDIGGEVMCTAPSNRSLIFWRDKGEALIYERRIQGNGMLFPAAALGISGAKPNPSCAVALGPNTFIAAAVSETNGLFDVVVQPYTSFAMAMGNPVDVGDTTLPNNTAAWSMWNGFMVAWIADPVGAGPITAQQLDQNGAPVAGAVFTMSDAADMAPAEPAAVRVAVGSDDDTFAFVYTRASEVDMHREVVLRMFAWPDPIQPPVGGPPLVVSADTVAQSEPKIAVNPTNGKFVVVWTSGAPNMENISYRAFEADGTPLADEALANQSLVGSQTSPDVTVDPVSGNVVIVWDNYTPNSAKPHKVSARILAGLLK